MWSMIGALLAYLLFTWRNPEASQETIWMVMVLGAIYFQSIQNWSMLNDIKKKCGI